ncbi:hypothetical protein, partial [Halomonas sp. 15WGF]|uniref:hypothetical protein n=1 Tax=Halomonas sp. 15WGF TaxID=2570357 RepID=UPI001484DAE0
ATGAELYVGHGTVWVNGDNGYIAMQVSGLEVLPGAGLTDSGDSQDEMLKKQQTQIELAHKQLDEEVRRKEVEFSHSRAINVFPKLAAYCKKSVHKTFYPNSRFIIICYERNNSLEGVHSNTVFCYPDKIISDWHEGLDKKEVARDIEALMVDVSSISEMMIDCLKVSPDLFPYFDAFLVDGGVDGGNVNYWDYIKMYYSYLLGLGDEEKYLNMSSCFRFSDGVVNEQWNQVGNLLS